MTAGSRHNKKREFSHRSSQIGTEVKGKKRKNKGKKQGIEELRVECYEFWVTRYNSKTALSVLPYTVPSLDSGV